MTEVYAACVCVYMIACFSEKNSAISRQERLHQTLALARCQLSAFTKVLQECRLRLYYQSNVIETKIQMTSHTLKAPIPRIFFATRQITEKK